MHNKSDKKEEASFISDEKHELNCASIPFVIECRILMVLNFKNEMLDDLNLFTLIIAAGSLNAAAQQQNIPTATLTRRLQKLEQALGCKLLHRNSRGLTLTQEGQLYYQRCQPLLAALLQNTQEIKANSLQTKGRIKLLAPLNLAIFPLKSFWSEFLKAYPEIELELQLDNDFDDLIATGADLALRIGQQLNSAYIQKRIGTIQTCIVAAPQYLAEHMIQVPQDLNQHNWLIASPLDHFDLVKQEQHYKFRPQKHRIKVNEISLSVHLAEQGLGLCYAPITQCEAALKDGRLVQVLPEWQLPRRHVYLVWQAQKALPARVRIFIEALEQFVLEQSWNSSY